MRTCVLLVDLKKPKPYGGRSLKDTQPLLVPVSIKLQKKKKKKIIIIIIIIIISDRAIFMRECKMTNYCNFAFDLILLHATKNS
jgi:hypothetical protein